LFKKIKELKKGILIVNLGTPDEPSRSKVYVYLKQFLLDKRVLDVPWIARQILVRGIIAPFRSKSSSDLYKMLWTKEGSPIKLYGHSVVEKLRKKVDKDTTVELAMRYQNPSIESVIKKMLYEDKIEHLTVFPMFPQYASASTGSAHEEVMRVLSEQQVIPSLNFISYYPTNEKMIDIFVENAHQYNVSEYDFILFSFHGLPQRQVRKTDLVGDHCTKKENCCHTMCEANKYCYSAQCHQTAFAIAKKMNLPKEKYGISFQSRLGRDPWLKPYSDLVLEEKVKEGYKKILCFSPAFVADCLETTIEIGHEYKEDFIEAGGEKLDLVASLNDNDKWVDAIYEMVTTQPS
jgi:protoporphyrin/coproporphyrin ferrochelatase